MSPVLKLHLELNIFGSIKSDVANLSIIKKQIINLLKNWLKDTTQSWYNYRN